ncbi:MAG: PAS domain S-box protein [Nitrospirota bacterium]
MKNLFSSCLTALLFLCFCSPSFGAGEPRVVRVGAFNYYPAIFQDRDGGIKGFYVDALAEVARQENIRFEYVFGSWSEGLERLKAGEVDVLTSVAYTPERAVFMDYAKTPLLTVWGELYAPLSSSIDGILHLRGKKVAVMKGDLNGQHFIDLAKKFDLGCEFVELPGFDDVFRAVSEKRVDSGVANNTFGAARQREYGLRSTGVVFNPFDIYFAVARGKNDTLLALLDRYLDGWRHQENSVYNAARQKWSHGTVGTMFFLPRWLTISAAGLGVLVLLSIAFIILLKRQVGRATHSLRQSEEKYRKMTENIKDVIWQITPDWKYTYVSPAMKAVSGFTPEEMIGRSAFEFFTPASRERALKKATERQGAAGQGMKLDSTSYEVEHVRKDGGTVLADVVSTPLYDRSGRLTGFQGITRDITERKMAEMALAASEKKFRDLLESMQLVAVILDGSGNLTFFNDYLLGLTGWPRDQVAGRNWFDLFIPRESRERVRSQFLAGIREGSLPLHYENVILTRDKDRKMVVWNNSLLRNAEGAIIGMAGIGTDVTEHRKLENQLRQSQKMESIGTLAGGVAHDFNNILTAITGYGHMTLMKMPPDDPHRLNLQHILEAADRAAHLTRDLLLFSRKQPIDRKRIDLNEVIGRLSKFLVRVIGEDIAFRTNLSGDVIGVLADQHQIDQVLMNLATNARDAMPQGGVFTITTDLVPLNAEYTAAHGLGAPGKYAVITVSDTGNGMDEETRQRIFEPFFTTKEVGKGTGLGLSVVYGIVKQHEGAVAVYSEPGQGTTFRIYLPAAAAKAGREKAAAEAEERPAGGTETVLLAEDDRTVRDMTRTLLENFGYTVITAADGAEAVEAFRENADRVQLLLFDLVMPRMSGADAYEAIRNIRPGIKIIVQSGYDPDMVRRKALLEQNVLVLNKPVPMAVLLRAIRSVLDGTNTRGSQDQ